MSNLEATAAKLLEILSTKISNVAPDAYDAAVRYYELRGMLSIIQGAAWFAVSLAMFWAVRALIRKGAQAVRDEGPHAMAEMPYYFGGAALAVIAIFVAFIALYEVTSPQNWLQALDGRMGIVHAVLGKKP
jgi:isoprenylcysteine carboxyl methyltransferase (ICMT) family protein YpbQ